MRYERTSFARWRWARALVGVKEKIGGGGVKGKGDQMVTNG
jgi:hypothetical protein